METEEKIKILIKRHAALRYDNFKNTKDITNTLTQAMDRIELEYIALTGYELKDNEEYKKLLKQYDMVFKSTRD